MRTDRPADPAAQDIPEEGKLVTVGTALPVGGTVERELPGCIQLLLPYLPRSDRGFPYEQSAAKRAD